MTRRVLFVIILAMVCAAPAWSSEKLNADDFIRFADNGNDLVVDLPGLVRALRSGADPNWVDPEREKNRSTLHQFVMYCSISPEAPQPDAVCSQAIKALIDAGAKLRAVDRSILFFPVANGKKDIVALLLDMGADPTAWPNEELGTALSPVEVAAEEGHQAIVDLLVAHGASRPNEREVVQLRFIMTSTFGTIDSLDKLIKKGATVNGRNRNDQVALVNAMAHILRSDCEAYAKVLYLLNAGADPNMSGKGTLGLHAIAPPLHHAVWNTGLIFEVKAAHDPMCSKMILSELIKRGAHVSSRDSRGRTPLHLAAEKNHLSAAQLLVEAGAKIKPRDETGKTPLDLAESGEIIKLLKSHGATER